MARVLTAKLIPDVGGCLGIGAKPVAPSELPRDERWQFEPKWDGFRCLAFRAGDEVEIRANRQVAVAVLPGSGREPSLAFADTFVLDGELVLPIGGTLSFDALQMRLHPAASRIERLSRETPPV